MERSVISVSILVLACLVGSAAALGATNVIAYYEYFNAIEVDYNMTLANGVDCAYLDADKPYEWRSKYNWTAAPNIPANCGLCLNVTNTGTGDQTTVRIVASCGDDDLVLDKPVFDQLDTDGKGKEAGHLTVDYVFVDCGLPINRLYAAQ